MSYTQQNRLLRITSSLGDDVLLLRRLTVTEAIGRLFTIDAEVFSSDDAIAAKDVIGTKVTCTVHNAAGDPKRFFHGVVRAFGRTSSNAQGQTSYWLQAVPSLWLLTRTTDCKIFQTMSAQDIVGKLLTDAGVDDKSFGTLPSVARDYCLQFNETDFDFASRLLDEVGAGYWFKHEQGKHTVNFTGAKADYPLVGGDSLVVREDYDRPNAITRWQPVEALQRSQHIAWDFDSETPSALQQKTSSTLSQLTPKYTDGVFQWPSGQHPQKADIDPSKLGMEQDEVQISEVRADSMSPTLFAGGRVKVQEGLSGSEATWLITALRHEAFDESHVVNGGQSHYANSMVLIPADTEWRNAHPRPRPAIPSLMSAIVTGPSGEEQYTDKLGRVKVQFHWDRLGKKDENTTCFIRVMQPWAGKWGGTWFLPRIGDEVMVAFLDGDVDRPVVIGSVYNNDTQADRGPPWALPGNMQRTGIRSRSTKGGTADNAHIIGFDDTKGREQLYIQAEKDELILVKNQKKTTVQGNEIYDITGESKNQPDGTRTVTVKGDDKYTIKEGSMTTTIDKGDETRTITLGKRTTKMKGTDSLTIDSGDSTTKISMGNESLEISMGNREAKITMGNDKLDIDMGNQTTKLGLGNISMKCDLGSVTIEAMQGITLKVGAASIKLDPMGVTIEGMMISVKGTMMTTVEGLMTTVKGTAMTKVNGGIIMIGPG